MHGRKKNIKLHYTLLNFTSAVTFWYRVHTHCIRHIACAGNIGTSDITNHVITYHLKSSIFIKFQVIVEYDNRLKLCYCIDTGPYLSSLK